MKKVEQESKIVCSRRSSS